MANINKYAAIKRMTGMNQGMPSKGAILAQGGDNVPAMIHDQSGTPQAPAALKSGEIVFSIPSIIGAGQGDFDKGAELLLELHDQLKEIGLKFLQQEGASQGIGGVSPQQQ